MAPNYNRHLEFNFSDLFFDEGLFYKDVDESQSCNIKLLDDLIVGNLGDNF